MNWIEGETPEQKHARIDQILEQNTQPKPVCVGCNKEITTTTPVETIKGLFHGFPMRCVYKLIKEN